MSATKSIAIWMAGAALLSACAGKPAPAPPPAVRQTPPEAQAAPPVEADSEDWLGQPLTPGDWSYDAGAGEARYAGFSLRCDSARRRISLSRAGASGPLRLRTSYGEHVLAPGAALAADDPRLDEIAFSRGRFAVDAQGMTTLVLPAWPEPARVIGDCRG
jgi:hypothetical protein